jgi:hypothetical protein
MPNHKSYADKTPKGKRYDNKPDAKPEYTKEYLQNWFDGLERFSNYGNTSPISIDVNTYNHLKMNGFTCYREETLPDGTKIRKEFQLPFNQVVAGVEMVKNK